MPIRLSQIAQLLEGELIGDPEIVITGVASMAHCYPLTDSSVHWGRTGVLFG